MDSSMSTEPDANGVVRAPALTPDQVSHRSGLVNNATCTHHTWPQVAAGLESPIETSIVVEVSPGTAPPLPASLG